MRNRQTNDSTACLPIRLNKYLAQAGIASRRAAENLIRAGRVTIDGIPVRTVDQVVPAGSVVTVDGEVVEPLRERIVLAMNKPPGVITTVNDPQGRPTVVDLLPAEYQGRGLVPVGRLDRDSSGLLLLSNDGALIHTLLHPSHKVWKRYRVQVRGQVTQSGLSRMRHGIVLEGRPTAPAQVRVVSRAGQPEATLEIAVREGRTRQIRRMCKEVGLLVTQLERISIGPIRLGRLREGDWRALTPSEVEQLRREGGL